MNCVGLAWDASSVFFRNFHVITDIRHKKPQIRRGLNTSTCFSNVDVLECSIKFIVLVSILLVSVNTCLLFIGMESYFT